MNSLHGTEITLIMSEKLGDKDYLPKNLVKKPRFLEAELKSLAILLTLMNMKLIKL